MSERWKFEIGDAFQVVPGRQPSFIGAARLPVRVLTRPLKRNVLAG